MNWSCFLHIYQPPNQHQSILERIANECYRPLFRGLKKIDKAKITLNINACLTEQLAEQGFSDVISDILDLVKLGRIELTESAKFHAFIPLIPLSEALRQVELNHQTNKKYFGDFYAPKGFFSPEMSYSPKVAEVAQRFGCKYVLLDEIAYNGKLDEVSFDRLYKIKGFDLYAFFREKRTSNLIMGATVRDAKGISSVISSIPSSRYLLTAMDGETFGHHRVGLDKVLLDILADSKVTTVTVSELFGMYKQVEEVEPKDSTWASSEKDIAEGNPFDLWFDQNNEIHKKEWELTDLAISVVGNDGKSRELLDQALHSCHYWWASAKPWWSIEMIEEGVFNLWQAVLNSPKASDEEKENAQKMYYDIISLAHSWQRTGFVEQKSEGAYSWKAIPFSKRAKPGEYKALIELLKGEEVKASAGREYEQALKWRDAIYKLESNLDVYDAVHIIDQLRRFVDFEKYENLVQKYLKEYKSLNSGQPEK